MKLYATVTSERASKGQGGNKYLKIVVTDENKENLLIVALEPYEDSVGDGMRAEITCADHLYTKIYGEQIETSSTKGEKQKGEYEAVDSFLKKHGNR